MAPGGVRGWLAWPGGVAEGWEGSKWPGWGGEAWSRGLRDAQRTRAAVNHQLVDELHELRAGDELAFFPPVTGG